ncbi:MAG: hypothetical protein QXV64_03760 [Candidatus Anstonellaceae archaeon]
MPTKDRQFLIVDTNFWLLFYERAINIIERIEDLFNYKPFLFLVPSSVLAELKFLSTKKNKKAIAARSSILLIEKLIKDNRLEIIPTKEKNTDSSIINLSRKKNAHVATADKELIKKLKKFKIPVITLKDKHNLAYV